VLVGTTSDSWTTTAGLVARASGSTSITRDGGTVLNLNRLTSDGEIFNLRKDGTTVGSIGSRSGVVTSLVLDPRTNGASLIGGTNKISAGNESGPSDGLLDLGSTANRFKDLHLSGGVYLGGTGAANNLDDYEEGTWTPAFGGETTAGTTTYTQREGYYTKVGNTVHASLIAAVSSATGTGNMAITGLPFSAAEEAVGSFQVNSGLVFTSGSTPVPRLTGTEIMIRTMRPDGSSFDVVDIPSSFSYMRLFITYFTNS
jgi:hypothetical protein